MTIATAEKPPLSTVVFDFGGVLLDWDPRYLYRKIFADAAEMEWFLSNVCTSAWNIEQDRGRPWPEGEAEAIARHPKYEAEIRAFRARWHEMIPAPVAGTVAILETLAARGVPLYAITNFAADTLHETRAKYDFFRHFLGVVVSGELGLLKPDPAIYRRLGSGYGLNLANCLFIDDVPKNVEGAKAVGMQAVQFTTADQLRADLLARGLPVG